MISVYDGADTKLKDAALSAAVIVFWPLTVIIALIYSAGRIWFHQPPK